MSEKLKVGILGGTGMVGQRFISLLENHPWFEVTTIAASPRSAGKTYEQAVGDRWKMDTPMPEAVKNIVVMNVNEVEKVAAEVDFVFSAVDMTKEEIKKIEEDYAKTETPVVSNNSAHRWTPDVPMVVPEVNPEHMEVIKYQKERLGTKRGFVAVKPNCSIQSYAPVLTAWKEFIHIVDSLRPDSVQFLFFFHPHKGINIHQILRMDGFIYPICIDERDSFNKLNKFPPDLNFQTFLLDKSNKVMAIGNPVHNPKVRDLYINIIQGKGETIEDEGIKTAISIKTTNLSLGVFDWQQEQKAEFILENAGDQPLVIDNVIASCGCVTTSYSKEPVRSNGSVSLSVKYKAERPEHFDKTIKVYCNAKSSLILLKITGDAR